MCFAALFNEMETFGKPKRGIGMYFEQIVQLETGKSKNLAVKWGTPSK